MPVIARNGEKQGNDWVLRQPSDAAISTLSRRGKARKAAFTLAESAHSLSKGEGWGEGWNKKVAFTLAEVLITLASVGVVAAMTIPTLVAKINDKVNTNQRKVVTSRLVDGLNQFNIMENGLAKSYNNTYEFLQGLSAHYKMSAICDAEHLTDCLPYSTISYDNSGTEENFNVSEIKSKLKFPDNFLEPAAFISAGGTPFVVAFSANCGELSPDSIDPDKKMSAKDGAITPCLSGIYDLNGTRTPNKIAT